MVSVNPYPSSESHGFYCSDPMMMMNMNMNIGGGGEGLNSNLNSICEDPNSKKIRKPYTITKSRENWTEQEHDKFLEALQLFDRDWKKIEAFVGSKTVIQIRSHAQKYFLKVEKSGTTEHVPPPRPKRKASHPYPQKAPKTASVPSQGQGAYQASCALHEPGYIYVQDPISAVGNPVATPGVSSWSFNSVPPTGVSVSQVTNDGPELSGTTVGQNCCYSSSNESVPKVLPVGGAERGDFGNPPRAVPDFSQVYSFIGSVFDPDASGQLERLKQMDPINLETVLLLMKNLSVNLTRPEFEDHVSTFFLLLSILLLVLLSRLLTNCDSDSKFGVSHNNLPTNKSQDLFTCNEDGG
ncbi:hypothetical protein ACFE04_026399 [Oxalis oulophora]